jgi:hypothetical protein
MPRSRLFTLGFYQKNFNSTSRITGPAINMGCTRGRASTTRMLNYCNQYTSLQSTCINNFININNTNNIININNNIKNRHMIKNFTQVNNKQQLQQIQKIQQQKNNTYDKEVTLDYENSLPELFDIYFLRKNNSEEWFNNLDV